MALNGGKGTLQHGLVPKQLVPGQRRQGEEQMKAWEREIKAGERERWRGIKANVFRLLQQSFQQNILSQKAELGPLPGCYVTRLQLEQHRLQRCMVNCNRLQHDGPEAGKPPEI